MGAELGSLPVLGALSHLGGTAFGATAHAAVHGAVHDAFMTLPPYTRTSEGEVHSRGLGVRNCSHRALSDPCQNKASELNGPVKPLQPKVQLVAQIVEQKLEALLAAVTR